MVLIDSNNSTSRHGKKKSKWLAVYFALFTLFAILCLFNGEGIKASKILSSSKAEELSPLEVDERRADQQDVETVGEEIAERKQSSQDQGQQGDKKKIYKPRYADLKLEFDCSSFGKNEIDYFSVFNSNPEEGKEEHQQYDRLLREILLILYNVESRVYSNSYNNFDSGTTNSCMVQVSISRRDNLTEYGAAKRIKEKVRSLYSSYPSTSSFDFSRNSIRKFLKSSYFRLGYFKFLSSSNTKENRRCEIEIGKFGLYHVFKKLSSEDELSKHSNESDDDFTVTAPRVCGKEIDLLSGSDLFERNSYLIAKTYQLRQLMPVTVIMKCPSFDDLITWDGKCHGLDEHEEEESRRVVRSRLDTDEEDVQHCTAADLDDPSSPCGKGPSENTKGTEVKSQRLKARDYDTSVAYALYSGQETLEGRKWSWVMKGAGVAFLIGTLLLFTASQKRTQMDLEYIAQME
eukprot:Nk52_evm24s245 gene=Nk52_evmTU24s245